MTTATKLNFISLCKETISVPRGNKIPPSLFFMILLSGCSETYYVNPLDSSEPNTTQTKPSSAPHTNKTATSSLNNLTTEDRLPVVYLSSKPGNNYQPNTFLYKGKEYAVEAKLRGAASRKYPMNSYTIKFNDDDRFTDKASGFTKRNKIVLTTLFDDNSFIRQRLAFALWNRLDLRHIQVNTSSCILYLNNKYHGLYVLNDHIDKHLIKRNNLNNDGELYKTVSYAADMYVKNDTLSGFEKKSGSESDEHLKSLIVTATNENSVSDTLKKLIHHHEFENAFMLITLLRARDTKIKNLYYYHVPLGRWKIIPWDFNESFGQNWKTYRNSPTYSKWYTDGRIFNLFVTDSSNFIKLKKRMYYHLTEGRWQLEWILGKIDSYYSEVRAAAPKSEQRWNKEYQSFFRWEDRNDFTNFEEEIEYIKQWISNRHAYLVATLNR